MTTTSTARCPLGISGKTLSSWRNDGLSASEARRVAAHTGDCPACQETLARYDEIRRALRSQAEPDGHDRLWRDVRMSIAQPGMRRHTGFSMNHNSLLPRLATVAAVLALIVAFVSVFGGRLNHQRGNQPQPQRVVVKSGVLSWTQVAAPPGFTANEPDTQLLVAEGAGSTAYFCGAARLGEPITLWVTSDRAAHWTRTTSTPSSQGFAGCTLAVDANNPHIVVANFFPVGSDGNAARVSQWTSYATMDGGTSWTKPDALQGMNVVNLASFHEHTYAIGTTGKEFHLYISDDQMRDWSAVDGYIFSTIRKVTGSQDRIDVERVWVNGQSGEIVAQSSLGSAQSALWLSVDNGYTWAPMPLPVSLAQGQATAGAAGAQSVGSDSAALNVGQVLVQLNAPDKQWRICGFFSQGDNVSSLESSLFACTTTDGQQWAKVEAFPQGTYYSPLALAPDGSLIGEASHPGGGAPFADMGLYRLAPSTTSASQWRYLGNIPGTPSQVDISIHGDGSGIVAWADFGNDGRQLYTTTYP